MIPASLLLLVACGGAWTWQRAVAPSFRRADTDRSGRIERSEYEAQAPEGPPFARADADGDGALDPAEFLGLALAQDPATFGDAPTRPPAEDTLDEEVQYPDPWEVRIRSEAWLLLAREVRWRDPEVPVPGDAEIREVATAGPSDPRYPRMRDALGAAWVAVGLTPPPSPGPAPAPPAR